MEVLVNNAGILIAQPIEEADPDKLYRIVTLHCTTPLLLCRLLIPLMKEQGCGYILNISSISAGMDWPLIGVYGSTKRFVKGYSRELSLELSGSPVSVTTAIFGAVDTPLLTGLPFMRFRKLALRLGFMITPEKATHLALKAMFKRRPASLADVVRLYLRESGMETPLLQKRLIEAWDKVTGPIVAQYTGEKKIRNQTLFVQINNPALKADLMMMQSQLVKRLNNEVGAFIIAEIRFF